MTAPVPAGVLATWQQALAAEHAAIFGYGELGPRLTPTEMLLGHADETAHRLLRDATSAALAAAGAVPVVSRADYPLPYAIDSASTARRLALRLEEACASAWRYHLATASIEPGGLAAVRASAQNALTASAVRASGWRALIQPASPFVAFPGI